MLNYVDLTNSAIYAEEIDPILPVILANPNAEALRTVGKSSPVKRYTTKNVIVTKNFPNITNVVVNQSMAKSKQRSLHLSLIIPIALADPREVLNYLMW